MFEYSLAAVSIILYLTVIYLYIHCFYRHSNKKRWYTHLAGGLLVFFFTAYLVEFGLARGRLPFITAPEALTTISWVITVMFIMVDLFNKDRSIGVVILPLAGLLSLVGIISVSILEPPDHDFKGVVFPMHVSFTLLAYAMYFFVFVLTLVYSRTWYNLKNKNFGTFFNRMPALKIQDKHTNHYLIAGNIFLPVGVGAGVYWAISGDLGIFSTKIKLGLVSVLWSIFIMLMILRLLKKASVRTSMILTSLGLLFIVLTFLFEKHARS